MTSSENPFDQTVWDPTDPEQAAEDPMHGPSAVYSMLQTPPMPLGDGTYYQPGGYYAIGTPYLDALDRPVYIVGRSMRTSQIARQARELDEWVTASQEGEAALKALETKRQRDRLDRQGFAHSFKPSDVCAGGERLEDCETASGMIADAQAYALEAEHQDQSHHSGWTGLSWLGRTCAACSLACEVAIQTQDGRPTGVSRITNCRPPEHTLTIEIKS